MKKSKIFILFSLLIIVLLFSVSALFQCGFVTPTTNDATAETAAEKTDVEESKESVSEETTSETTSNTEETTDQTEETSATDQSTGNEAPTIKLEIYEGPTYSAADDICFYRVKAVVTGKPAPTVKFSKDDSNGAWGTKKTQINIPRDGTYTLTATAKNSEGQATDSIVLNWDSGVANRNPVINDITLSSASIKTSQQYDVTGNASDPDGDTLTYKWTVSGGAINNDAANPMKWTTPAAAGSYTITLKVTDGKGGEDTQSKDVSVEAAIVSLNVPKVGSEGGYIEQGGYINNGGGPFAGDSKSGGAAIGDRPVRGYISFNITGLAGATVDEATVTFSLKQLWGNVAAFGSLWVGVVDWGAEPLVLSDFDLLGVGIQQFSAAGSPSFTVNAAALKT
ncbi:MAG: PKD domain-containing protein [Actinobacteria bacterium]|nr:PKD domain-containing protein [Actinomycetota bacterium]